MLENLPPSGDISKSECTSKVPLSVKTFSKTLLWVDWTSVSCAHVRLPRLIQHSFRLVVTTFELARDDIEQLGDQHWSCVIVDEVHRVKNPKSRTSKTLNMFRCPVRLGLTGTIP
jgi:SNF2 family DNA or RNA helicase